MAGLTGQLIGGFRVVRDFDTAGAQGAVCCAVCESDIHGIVPVGTEVALKIMQVSDPESSQWRQLERRVATLKRLDHPNIVKYYGCFVENGQFSDIHVIVQEFLHGKSLKELLAKSKLGLEADETLRIVREAVAGLSYAERSGIIHRDVKPGNIMVCDDGAVKLIDFEVAKNISGGTLSASTTGGMKGTLAYMAPEFTNSDFRGDEQSDIFSMGVVFYETLMGRSPYRSLHMSGTFSDFAAFFERWRPGSEDPIRISRKARAILSHAEEVFTKSLARERTSRYETFEQFGKGLETVRPRTLKTDHGTYEMQLFVGEGGFGQVYKARNLANGEEVAVKFLLSKASLGRFRREARIMAGLEELDSEQRFDSKGCFVKFVDYYETTTSVYLIMAYLAGMPGLSLRDAIRSWRGVPRDEAMTRDILIAFERYAWGLGALHWKSGIIHRDIKPSNLYFPIGKPENAAIMDLGIALDLDGHSMTTGQIPGTFDYMPPETIFPPSKKFRGDPKVDIYALGLCLYEALTGKMGYPRLPSTKEEEKKAISMITERARSKKPPLFDDPSVSNDSALRRLLVDMTNPVREKRLEDAFDVCIRLREIITGRYGYNPAAWAQDGERPTEKTDFVRPDLWEELKPEQTSSKPWLFIGCFVAAALAVAAAITYRFLPRGETPAPVSSLDPTLDAIPPEPASAPAVASLQVVVRNGIGEKCILWKDGGEKRTFERPASITLEPGEYKYVFERAGYKPQEQKSLSLAAGGAGMAMAADAWEPLDVQMEVGELEPGVTLMIDGKRYDTGRHGFAPGEREAVYSRAGYEDERVKFTVAAGTPGDVPFPSQWRAKPVKVEIGELDADVQCYVNGDLRRSGDVFELSPDKENKVFYSKPGFDSQNIPFFLSLGKDGQRVPAPGAWKPVAAVLPPSPQPAEGAPKAPASATLTVSYLPEGYRCFIDGVERTPGSIIADVAPGEHVCRYERDWYEPQQAQKFAVAAGEQKLVPPPSGEWTPCEVDVTAPQFEEGTTCRVGKELFASGQTRKLRPGRYTARYSRGKGWYAHGREFTVEIGKPAMLPQPDEWRAVPEKFAIPQLESGVRCKVDGVERQGGSQVELDGTPGSAKHTVEYERAGYESQSFEVTAAPGGAGRTLPPPGEWAAADVAVTIGAIGADVRCRIGGVDYPAGAKLLLAPGTHAVAFQRAGFVERAGSVVVEPGRPATVELPAGEWVKRKAAQAAFTVPALGEGAKCIVEGKGEWPSGATFQLPPGEHTVKYVRKGFEDQIFRRRLLSADSALPQPEEWLMTREAERAERGITDLVENWTVAKRRANLAEAEKLLRENSRLLPDAVCETLRAKIEEQKNLAIGEIFNLCPFALEVGGRIVAAEDTTRLVFTNGIPAGLRAVAKGYKPYALPADLNNSSLTIRLSDLEPEDVALLLPEGAPGDAECFFRDSAGSLAKVGAGGVKVRPGRSYSCVWRRKDHLDIQKNNFYVEPGRDATFPLPADSEWRVADLVVKVEPFAVGVNCQIDGRNVPKPGNATLSPGRHVVEYSREDYKPQTIEFEVSLAARTVPRADDAKWQPTAALTALEKALASAATAKSSEDWDAVLKLVNQADVLARDNRRKRDELRDKAGRARREGDSRAKVADMLAKAQMCYENQIYRDVVVQYSNARDNGHILDDNETYMLEDAFNQQNIYYDRHLKEWRSNVRLGRRNTRSLEAIQKDKSELLRLYMNAKRK